MEPIDERLLKAVDGYVEALFVPPDPVMRQGLLDAQAAGMPAIQVSPTQGKLLFLIAKIAHANRILEIGTLGGYSTTWLARALPPEGVLITLELDPKHAGVARKNLKRAGLDQLVDVRVGVASGLLTDLIESHAEPFDLIFIDADKPGYREYLDLSIRLSHRGTVILADNLIRNGRVLEEQPPDENARGARAYNRAIAEDLRLDSIILPLFRDKLDGMSISVVK